MRWLAAATLCAAAQGTVASPIACSTLVAAVNEAASSARDRVSADEAATSEAVDAAKRCLANIARALNQIAIPGVSLSIDLSGILNGMLNRACRVVTTQIDQAGRVVRDSVSGPLNRVIRDVNSTLPPGSGGVVRGGATTNPVGNPGVTSGAGGLSGTINVPSVPVTPTQNTGVIDRLSCTLRGTCN